MKLEDLPCSILRQILDREASSWCAIELWKCGNRALNSRLANKGVTEIWLTDVEVHSTSRWPRCLREFALERLSVDRGASGALGTTLALRSELQSLSSSLKSLKVVGRGAGKAFFYATAGQQVGQTSKSSPAGRTALAEDSNAELYVALWNLDTTWPQLERLEIGGDHLEEDCEEYKDYMDYMEDVVEEFGTVVFEMLPRSLTYLALPFKFDEDVCDDLRILPRGLRTLHLEFAIGSDALKTLPRTLTDVGLSLTSEAVDTLFKRPNLLPNLIDFPHLDSYYLHDEIRAYVTHHRMLWPKSIRTLPAYYTQENAHFNSLPPNLIHLATNLGQYRLTLLPRYIARLPRTLETLTLLYIQWKGVKVEDWPQNLTHLTCRTILDFGAHRFNSLPRSLKRFGFSTMVSLSDKDTSALEKLRKSFSIEQLKALGRESLKLDAERWSVEKARLLTPRYVALGSEAYIKRVEEGELFGLPLGLTKLDLTGDTVPYPQKFLLPPHLHHFPTEVEIDDPNGFDFLPPTDSMRFAGVIFASERMRHDSSSSEDPFKLKLPSESALFRSNLVSLDAHFLTPGLYFPVLAYLPRTLRSLNIVGPNFFTPADLENLPSTLETLIFNFNMAKPLDPWTHLLPRNLRCLKVSALILGSDLAHLPPKLEEIEAAFFSVTLAQVRQMPRGLRTVDVKLCLAVPDGRNKSLLHSLAWKALIALCRPFWRIREYSEAYLLSELDLASESWPKSRDAGDSEGMLASWFPDAPEDKLQFTEEVCDDEDEDDLSGADDGRNRKEERVADENDDTEDDDEDDDIYPYHAAPYPEEKEEEVAYGVANEARSTAPQILPLTLIVDPSEDLDPRAARRFPTVPQ